MPLHKHFPVPVPHSALTPGWLLILQNDSSVNFPKDPVLTTYATSECVGPLSASPSTPYQDTQISPHCNHLLPLKGRNSVFHPCDLRNLWPLSVHWKSNWPLFSYFREPRLISYINQVFIKYCSVDKEIKCPHFKKKLFTQNSHYMKTLPIKTFSSIKRILFPILQ